MKWFKCWNWVMLCDKNVFVKSFHGARRWMFLIFACSFLCDNFARCHRTFSAFAQRSFPHSIPLSSNFSSVIFATAPFWTPLGFISTWRSWFSTSFLCFFQSGIKVIFFNLSVLLHPHRTIPTYYLCLVYMYAFSKSAWNTTSSQ